MNNRHKFNRAQTILRAVGVDMDSSDFDMFNGYYNDDSKPVISGDWNVIKPNELERRVERLLEQSGFEIAWCDEVAACGDCGMATPLHPGCYGDLNTAVVVNDCLLCPKCVRDNPTEYLESLINNPKSANKLLSSADLIMQGFREVETNFKNGFYPGQTDDPKVIFAKQSKFHDRLLFSIDGAGQFSMSFSLWTDDKRESDI